jgi:hypothetical protein
MRRTSSQSRAAASVALATTLVVAFGGAASAARKPHWTWRSLHRPLHIPHIPPGASCPLSPKTKVDLGQQGVLALPGRGPAYPNFGGAKRVLEFWWPPLPQQTDFYGTGWSGNKVLWWVSGRYHGPVLIRGRQLDGPHLLRFDVGTPPPAEMRIRPGRGFRPWKGARDRPSYTRVEAAGCYGYQVDGIGFSRVIVFQAVQVAPPSQP